MSTGPTGDEAQALSARTAAHLRSRLEALRFTPALHAALCDSPLGSLPYLLSRLSPEERENLRGFERLFTEAHRLERLGELSEAALRYRAMLHRHSRLRPLIAARLAAIGHPLGEPAEERRDG